MDSRRKITGWNRNSQCQKFGKVFTAEHYLFRQAKLPLSTQKEEVKMKDSKIWRVLISIMDTGILICYNLIILNQRKKLFTLSRVLILRRKGTILSRIWNLILSFKTRKARLRPLEEALFHLSLIKQLQMKFIKRKHLIQQQVDKVIQIG